MQDSIAPVPEASGPSRLRLSSLLSLVSVVLVAGAVASAGLTFWVVLRTTAIEHRMALAQASYAEHLALEANLFQLFKEKADAALIGNRDQSRTETDLKARIDANLRAIQQIIGREIDIDAEEELEELELLALLDRKIRHVIADYDDILQDANPLDLAKTQAFVYLLDTDIDGTLDNLISVALAGEVEEVNEAAEQAQAFRQLVAVLAAMVVGVMLCTSLTGVLIYRRTVARPLTDLVAGAGAYRRGVYDTPIPAAGALEFRQLATTLTEMAAEIGARERALRSEARLLETRVGERTAELQTILIRFEQVEASRRQMMADVSHELRTPMTIIQGEADIALRSGLADPAMASESFGRIRDAARHSNRIVDDLLLVAREEAGQLRLDLRSVDLDAALADAAGLAQAKVEILRLGRPAPARVDPVRLRQCLLAVMNNALRYGGRNVRSWVERGANGFDILVEDDGPGMSDAEKDQAFTRFFRGSGAQSTGVEGTGLGLPIVRSIMAAHGGSVDLSDREGGGLVVRLRFAATLRPVQPPIEGFPARKAE